MKPIILVTASLTDDEKFLRVSTAYTHAVERAGGIPLVPDCAVCEDIPHLLEIADGLLLSGGGDIDPSFFGEAPMREIGEISPMRDKFELELARRAAGMNMPVLAICRGAQILNVAFGGKVYQDIYAQIKTPVIKHSQQALRKYASHSVQIKQGTALGKIVGGCEMSVNSFHHQAVSDLGDGVCVSAAAPDGVIEAIEHNGLRFCLGVQWHPEHMLEQPAQFEIFREFIKKAVENNEGN